MSMRSSASLIASFRRFSQAAGSAVIVIAVLVLAGWWLDVESLRSLLPSTTAMNPGGTAVAFLLIGLSLWLHSTQSRAGRRVAIICA